MSNYAKVLNGIVTQVIVAEADFFTHFVDTTPGQWIQTSYNTKGNVHYAPNTNTPDGGLALRGNFAGVGYIYDAIHDVFYEPQPFPSWTLNQSSWLWKAPITMPTDGNVYEWDEATKSWVFLKNT